MTQKPATFLLFITVFMHCVSHAQLIKMLGEASIFRSKYKTGTIKWVKGAYITALKAKSAVSDDRGKFQMEFIDFPLGTTVKLTAEKYGLTVVNSYDLEQVVLGRLDSIRIFFAPRDEIVRDENELYNIGKDALEGTRDALLHKLKSSEKEAQKVFNYIKVNFGISLETRTDAEAFLIDKMAELQNQLPTLVQQLASQNFDYSSQIYISAYKTFRKGDIEKALLILDSAHLENDYKAAMKNKAKALQLQHMGKSIEQTSDESIQQNISSRALKGHLLSLNFNYPAAAKEFKSICQIYLENEYNLHELSGWLSTTADMYRSAVETDSAIRYDSMAIEILQTRSWPSRIDLAMCYNNISLSYANKGELDKALYFSIKQVELLEKNPRIDKKILMSAYQNLARIYGYNKDYSSDELYCRKAIVLQKQVIHGSCIDLVRLYNDIGMVFTHARQKDSAISYLKNAATLLRERNSCLQIGDTDTYYNIEGKIIDKTLTWQEMMSSQGGFRINSSDLTSPTSELAISYGNLGFLYKAYHQDDTALQYILLAIDIREKSNDKVDSKIIGNYNDAAFLCELMGKYDSAVFFIRKCINLLNNLGDSLTDKVAGMYDNAGTFFSAIHKYDSAKLFTLKAVEIRQKILDPSDTVLSNTYHNLAQCYVYLRKYDSAIIWFSREANILIRHSDPVSTSYLLEAYQALYQLYSQIGDRLKAEEYNTKARFLQQSLHH